MPLFAMYGWDGPDGAARRKIHRSEHLARLAELDAQGRVVAAGPLTDGVGSLLIIDFPDRQSAESWMSADAYVREGIFVRTEVHPYTLVFPAP
jgi:uncharacterized protein YciI